MKNRKIGLVLSYIYTALNIFISLFFSSYLLRSLGDTEYGLYQTVSSFVTYLVLLEFGTGTLMSRNIVVAKNKGDNRYLQESITSVWYLSIFLSVIICLVAAVFYINIGRIYSRTMTVSQVQYAKKIFIWMVGYLIFSFLAQTLTGIFLGMENYKLGQILNIGKLLLRTILLLCLITYRKRGIIIAIVDFSVAMTWFLFAYCYSKNAYKLVFKIRDIKKKILIQAIPLCSALLIQSLVNQANNSVDKFIIGIKMSLESVALYSVAQYIYTVFSSVTTVPISMYLPQIAKDIGNEYSGSRVTNSIIPPSRLISFLGGVIMFGFFACGRQFVAIVYGESKVAAWSYALIIMAPMFLNMLTGPIINVLDVLNKRQFRSYALLLTTILNILLTVILLDLIGVIGAVIATAVSTIIGQVLIMNRYYAKKLDIDIWKIYKGATRGITIFQLLSAIVAFGLGCMISNRWMSFLVAGMVFTILSLTLSFAFGMSKDERKKVVTKVFK